MRTKGVKRRRQRRQSSRRIYVYILIMVVIVCLYMLGHYYDRWGWLIKNVETIIAIIAAVAFWLEYYENKQLNEAQFIMDLNEQFLGDERLSDIEWELEKYYNRYRKNELTTEYEEEFERRFDLENRERQYLVNYLVHLEGIAALVNNGVIHLNAIDDLMSYRYFVAVNNPIVQKLELLEYPDYYKGCIGIYDEWVKELLRQRVAPPMYNDENNLTKKLQNKVSVSIR